MSLNTNTPPPDHGPRSAHVGVPYIQNLAQFVGNAAYLYFIYIYPRLSTNTGHAKLSRYSE